MPVNLDKPHLWKTDIAQSVDMYNDWFMQFAPQAFRETRMKTTAEVEAALKFTDNLRRIEPATLKDHPKVLSTLRMATCPPIAVDRLVGLSGASKNLVGRMEEGRIPSRMDPAILEGDLQKICTTIRRMADPDIFVWLDRGAEPAEAEVYRAATIVADRLCGAMANPIIRNAQEKRQLAAISAWLQARGYRTADNGTKFNGMAPGTFSFRMNVPVTLEGGRQVNIPVDAVILPKNARAGQLPVFFEAKSAGDFTNVNKRRKEEAVKMTQLRNTHGPSVSFSLFLCGYFDSGYLGYEAAEGIDWVWEHRIDDMKKFAI
ncbi:XamI family restriction endonuclease [Oleispirillum naphthae]|uniref:XamI family restriction endonuclease n=1 Tax=Oleispirillum naphthae TaxID=2838853 RepID=UPI00308261B4